MPGTLVRVRRGHIEAAAPYQAGALPLAELQVRQLLRTKAQAMLIELLLNPSRALTRCSYTHPAFDEAIVTQEVGGLQCVENVFDAGGQCRIIGSGIRFNSSPRGTQQLAAQFTAALLSLGQPTQGPSLQGWVRALHAPKLSLARRQLAGLSTAIVRTPIDSRTLFSISTANAVFSRRNSRALSLPWPIFSPL